MDKELKETICKQVEERIKEIGEEGIQGDNLIALSKLVDIHKDLANEEYWNIKKEVMNNELQNEKIRKRIWCKRSAWYRKI